MENVMHRLIAGLVVAAALATFLPTAIARADEPMKCEAGPLKRTYGGTAWLVYGCTDNESLVFVSDVGNPAMPFYFMFTPIDAVYQLHGEGTGDKTATAAAFGDLKAFTGEDIQSLLAATKAVPKPATGQ